MDGKTNVKSKLKLLRNKIVIISFLVLAILAIVIIFKENKNEVNVLNPEIARSMVYGQVADGEEATNSPYVNFDAFFLRDLDGDGYAESIRGTCREVGKEDTLYMELNVLTEGYLKDGVITINNDNFYLQTAIPKDGEIKNNAIGVNTKVIELNTINNGTQKLLTGIVRTGDYSYTSTKTSAIGNDTTKYNRINSITLTGTYVAEDGTETQIEKTVEFNVDWYETTKAEIPSYFWGKYNLNQEQDNSNILDEENGEVNLEFEFITTETKDKLILKSSNLEGEIPQLNGYNPIRVEITGRNVTYEYNEETRKFIAKKEAILNEDGVVTSQAYDGKYSTERYNTYKIKVTYPIEAYQMIGADTVEIRIPVKAYYEGYNNTNSEFNNPYKSNVASNVIVVTYRKPEGTVAIFDVTVGKYVYTPTSRYIISKEKALKIYNGLSEKEINDNYIVRWYGGTGSNGQTTGMIMKETKDGVDQVSDQFIKSNSDTISMDGITTNVGIYFSNPEYMLGEDGWIKVYNDETNELLGTFTKDNWLTYSSTNPYCYELPVKHIRIETSETNADSSLSVYNIKELNDEYITENFEREEFDTLKYIKSTLTGYVSGLYVNTDTHQANYETPYALATVSASKTAISTQETEKNMKIKITTKGDEIYNQVKWTNGAFLLKLPKDILDIELNDVTINDSSVKITSYEQYEQDGIIYIKILTQNETKTAYEITVDCDITPDPRIPTTTETVELYASNEEAVDYYYKNADIYDINGNLNVVELINKTTTNISLVSPNSLLTNESLSKFDNTENIVVAPKIAEIAKTQRKANVNIELNNNYTSTISEVQILGRVPYEGNKYVINGTDMGSNFTTTMSNTGIILPEEIKTVATIYYSENGSATQDITDEANKWTTTPTDFSKVKSYLIDLGEYVLSKGERIGITYEINIPEGVNYNQISYSHHAVYFSLDTDQGKYRTQTEPNKIGFMIAKQYDLELVKYQKGKDKTVAGATYAIFEEGQEEAKTCKTEKNGTLKLPGLYVDRTYSIKEIISPSDYELNSEEIKFTTSEENGELKVTLISGVAKNITAVQAQGEKDYKVHIEVEDEVKASLKITKVEAGTEIAIKNVKYKITGKNLPSVGKVLTTDEKGEANITGLTLGEEYILEETKAEGYYLANPVKFVIANNNGVYDLNIQQGVVKNGNVVEEASIPTANIKLEDEKIPLYDLEIIKIKKTTEVELTETEVVSGENAENITYLAGAKFKLYKNGKELGEYITDENGRLTINNLYQYETEKNIDQTYILKEVLAPDGYAKVKDITFRVEDIEGLLEFQEEVEEGQTKKFYESDSNKVVLTIEDNPSFKLIKKDKETGNLLSNIKFAIYNVDGVEKPAVNSKGEIVGTKEIINGKEYYTVSTDEKGEITADLTEGLYKAVEVQAPEQYDISKATYYFGIGASREVNKSLQTKWAKTVGESAEDRFESIATTTDGGYIAGGYFKSSSIDLGNGIILNNNGTTSYFDGIIVKYNNNGEVEWGKSIGGSRSDYIYSVSSTSDGGAIVGGHFESASIDLGNGITLNNKGSYYDGMIIKLTNTGEIEWAKVIGGSYNDHIYSVAQTKDEGYIVGGDFYNKIDLGNGIILNNNSNSTDGMVIKLNSNGEAEWGKSVIGNKGDIIASVAESDAGGYIAGGYFESTNVDLGDGIVLNNNSTSSYDGIIIKYDENGRVEWGKAIGGNAEERVKSVVATTDGGYIAGGYFKSSNINLGNGVILNNKGTTSYFDGMIIKYNAIGETEWAKVIGNSKNDYILEVAETSDGNYIACGNFYSDSIELENGITMFNTGAFNDSDGMLIKLNSEGKTEYFKSISGMEPSSIRSIAETNDKAYIAGGYFQSDMSLGDEVFLNNKGGYDGMLIKFTPVEVPEVVIKQSEAIGGSEDDYIFGIDDTSDGGYIVGGYYQNELTLANGITLKSNGGFDIVIIKYSITNEIEWVKSIGGKNDDFVETIATTSDGGYAIAGSFGSNLDLGNGVVLNNNGDQDIMLIKLNSEGDAEWATSVGSNNYEYIESMAITPDDGYIVAGYFNSNSINLENGMILNNKGDMDALIIKFNFNGEVEWAKSIGGTGDDSLFSVAVGSDGGCLVGGYFNSSSINLKDGLVLNNNGDYDSIIIKLDNEGKIEWGKALGGSELDCVRTLTATTDGDYVIGVRFGSSNIELGNGKVINNQGFSNGCSNGMLIRYSSSGEVKWGKSLSSSYDTVIMAMNATNDGGIVIGGQYLEYTLHLDNGIILNQNVTTSGMLYGDIMLIKYNADGETEWGKSIGGSNVESISKIKQCSDGTYLAGGFFGSDTIKIGDKTLRNNGNYDGIILKFSAEVGVPEINQLLVENSIKEFKITTDVKEINGIKGGSITGENKNPYEKVKYGDASTKEIKMIPDENYEIIGITVNGEEYQFEKAEDGSYTMPQFENMLEDKHIVVTYAYKDNKITINKVDSVTKENITTAKFRLDQIDETLNESELYHVEVKTNSNGQAITQIPFGKYTITEIEAPEGYELNESPIELEFKADENHEFTIENTKKAKVIVHHYKAIENVDGTYTYTEERLAEDELLEGKIGEKYSTVPNLNIEKYELIKDEEGNYILPENALGTYEYEDINVNYYYTEKEIPLTVHHYIEGTEIKVPLKNGTVAEDEQNSGKEGEQYTTSEIANEQLSDEYELVEKPENSTGTYDGDEIIVTYYYKKIERDVTLIKYKENGTTPLEGAKFTIDGVEYITNEKGKINVTLGVGTYNVTETEAPEGYQLPENPITEISITRETTTREIEIINEKIKGTVIVHHYIEGTTNKVLLSDGTQAQDETKTGNVGDMYATKPVENLSEKYELIEVPENSSGSYIDGNIEVIYYYRLKDASVIVHHYKAIENADGTYTYTEESLSEDVTITGKVDDEYITTVATDIPEHYELVEEPTNKEGTMTPEQIEVIYYYKLKKYNYVVNYLEKGTNEVLYEQKQENGIIYGTEITSSNEVITIDGYNYDSVDKDSLIITTNLENNVINIYYTKRNDLSYTVNYLEKGTNKVLHEQKVVNNQTFETVITSADEVITIDGYNYDSVDKDKLTITTDTSANVINIYYTKKNDLSYRVNYLEKNTNKVLHEHKVANNQVFGTEITSADEVITIDGYNYDSVDKDKLTITTDTENNVINIYYTKKNDLSYTVNYLEKDTNKVLYEPKVANNQVFGTEITSADEVITIDGYNYDSVDKDKLTITTDTSANVINIYYTKKNDLSYRVNYLEKDTNKVLHEQKVAENITFGDVIISSNEVIDIYGYNYDSVDKENITIKTNAEENVINIFYTKKDTSVIVHYYIEGTTNKVPAQDGSLVEDVTIEGKVFDEYETEEAENVSEKYELVQVPDNSTGTMTEDIIEVIYYYRLKDTSLIVKYLEKGSNKELATQDSKTGKVDDEYTTTAKEIENYELVEDSGNTEGKLTVEPITVIYYYLQKTKVIVNHIDKNKLEGSDAIPEEAILAKEEEPGLVGDTYTSSAKDFEGYVLVEKPEQETVIMEKDVIILNYYYVHVSAGVVEKHIDINSNKVLDNAIYEGNEGEAYTTSSKEFEGYEIVTNLQYYNYNYNALLEEYDEKTIEEVLNNPANDTMEKILVALKIDPKAAYIPKNATGTMTIDPIEVKYYYIRPASVRVEYIDKITGEKILENGEEDSTLKIHGHEGDFYKAIEKEFEEYDIIKEEYPENAEGEMKVIIKEDGTVESETVVKYYYVKKSAGVVERHYDEKTGKLLEKETEYVGHEGDPYSTKVKEFEGYDVVEEKLPTNKEGTMTVEQIVVNYYYIRKAQVIERHYDIKTGELLEEETKYEGHEGDEYKTKEKVFNGYDLVEEKYPENTEGIMQVRKKADGTISIETIVNYYYVRKAQVIERHIDEETGKLLEEATIHEGHDGDSYKTSSKEFKGYELNKTKLPENAEGTMKVEVKEDGSMNTTIIVNYYYKKVEEPEKSTETSKDDTPTKTIINNIYNTITNNTDTTVSNNKTGEKTPKTGDLTPVITMSTIALIVLLNVIQLKVEKQVKCSRIQKSIINSKISNGRKTSKGKRFKK